MIKKALLVLSLLFFINNVSAQKVTSNKCQEAWKWADSVINTLSLEEKIGQLFIIRAHSDKNKKYHDRVGDLIRKYHVGGVCFFQGNPLKQAQLTNEYQQLSNIPLFVALDAEWGLGMRLDNTISYPKQMILGALNNDSLIFEMGKQIGKQCNRIGVNVNFAPVVDVNNNPKNPVINVRSFGENPKKVSLKAKMYMEGLYTENVISCLKHFPGHGDTDTDSHLTLPTVDKTFDELKEIELYPYQYLVEHEVPMIMVGHLFLPSMVRDSVLPSSLAKQIITGYLRNQLDYKGLVITDALEMKGIIQYVNESELEITALNAGVDILLMPLDLEKSIQNILTSLEKNEIDIHDIDQKVYRILMYKYLYQIHEKKTVDLKNIEADIHPNHAFGLINEIASKSVTLLKNNNQILPIQSFAKHEAISIAIGTSKETDFQKKLSFYDDIECVQINSTLNKIEKSDLKKKIAQNDIQIISLHQLSRFSNKNYGINSQQINLIKELSQIKPTILIVFGTPYILEKFNFLSDIEAIIIGYSEKKLFQESAAQIIYGGIAAEGTIPVSANREFKENNGLQTKKNRLGFIHYSQIGIKDKFIKEIDSIANDGIQKKAYPGCQLVMVKDGNIFYQKTYGYHTYQQKRRVKNNDVYDIASITKVVSTAISMMKLKEENKINLDYYLSDYLPYLKNTNKDKIIIRDVLTHQAGFQSWIPYFLKTLEDNGYKKGIYSDTFSEKYNIEVADNLYLNNHYHHLIFDTIITSPLLTDKTYLYSDLGFYLLSDVIERITDTSLNKYVENNFYQKLGMSNTMYLPKKKISKNRIIPTENDRKFRKQLLHGDVHDQGAAMMGGISGHAGVFSTAEDLAKLMQMLLNKGTYGEEKILDPKIINEFTREQYPFQENRRGLIFDRPEYDKKGVSGPTCEGVSDESFGHSGFTGTYVWADPANNTIYVFLSNRIHPDAKNTNLMKMNIRTKIHQVMYDALNDADNTK